jgi:ABC-type branched-subunit amino acid transport system ATPase component
LIVAAAIQQTEGQVKMDKQMLQEHLRLAEEHVALGLLHIATQRKIIATLTAAGADLTLAQSLLKTFESTQAQHVADRDRIAAELAKS